MHATIKEMSDQCWDTRMDGLPFDQNQFAELSILECMRLADRPLGIDGLSDDYLPSEKIAEHFGVK